METLRRLPLTDCDVFQKLEQISDISALSKEDRMKYDESIKVYRDRLAIMAFERQKGQAEGKLEVARNLKQMGLATEAIAQATGGHGARPGRRRAIVSRLLPQNDEKERRSFDQMADFLLLCTLVNVPYDIFVCKNLS